MEEIMDDPTIETAEDLGAEIARLRERIVALNQKGQELSAEFGRNNPALLNIGEAIRDLQEKIAKLEVERIVKF
jgi:hypothetical protein